MRQRVTEVVRPEIGEAILRFRKDRGLTQAQLAERLGVRQSAVARWEKGTDRPSPAALKLISEIAPEGERQWWRDSAAEIAGLGDLGNGTFGGFSNPSTERKIPLVRNLKRVGTLGTIPASDIEANFFLPNTWFAEGGAIQAARIRGIALSPFIDGEVIALIDASQRDPDRLVGAIVAVKTVEGIDVRRLHKDRNSYILLPAQEGRGLASLWRPQGENSILGKVVRWISEPAKAKGK